MNMALGMVSNGMIKRNNKMSTLNIQTNADLKAAVDGGMLTGLEWLDLRNTLVTDLAPIACLTWLEWLDIYNTGVTDITPIDGLTGLKYLYLDSTVVTDMTPIAGLIENGLVVLE